MTATMRVWTTRPLRRKWSESERLIRSGFTSLDRCRDALELMVDDPQHVEAWRMDVKQYAENALHAFAAAVALEVPAPRSPAGPPAPSGPPSPEVSIPVA